MQEIRLINGEAIDEMSLIGDNSIDAVIVDPPYGTTRCKWDSIIDLEQMWRQLNRIGKINCPFVFTATQPFTSALVMSNPKNFRYTWVWDKVKGTGFLNAKKMPMRNHEDIVVFYRKLPTYNPQKTTGHKLKESFRAKHLQTEVYGKMKNDYKYSSTERYPRSVQVFSTDTQSSSFHPTQKPLALMEYLVKTYTNEGDRVLDFAMGSGTTGLACRNLKRSFIGIDKEREYFDIAKERITDV